MKQFTAGDRSPYTYIIRFLKTNQFYYGVRYAKGCTPDEIGKTYFSSSNAVKSRLLTDNPSDVIFEVRRVFTNTDAAKLFETRFLQRVDARHNPKLLNRHNNDGCYPVDNRGAKNPAYGKPGTMLGKKYTEESRQRLSKAKTGELNGFFGKSHSVDTVNRIKQAQSGSKSFKFAGLYHTPHGIFESSRAAKINGLSHSTIKFWCRNCDIIITNYHLQSKYLSPSNLGKSFREIGFWFEPKSSP